ncbi:MULTISPECIES: helix-turn-helix domain-containing protein [Enterococcus]|uniref:Helix-turn-helix transcriptional regulator n=1 Tax=Enterococcus dongliensis TaxID=2559925 RepID=A0ABU3ESN7_9ENTE|nr:MULTISPECIES: helix-turn-helix transcriptional regulator [Enterococcus]MDT2597880.1 helix-turn-helix transcriptional regulator [Enterococcus dongliensis]MDT2648467.1 helix-turn-helix transcriptional regulator [Enterococcus dongliensis]STP39308.1 Predicted transcriptional regulator [Enterococcus durans]
MITNNLYNLMKKKNINITKLSEETDISRNTISSFLNSEKNLTAYKTKTIEILCAYFGIGIDDLLVFIDESIAIQELFSITPSDRFKITPKGNSFFEGDIDFTLLNKYENSSKLSAKVTCTTKLSSEIDLTDVEGFEDKKVVIIYNLYEVEIDNRFPQDANDHKLSDKIIDDLIINTDFIGTVFIPYIPDLWESEPEKLSLKKNPFYKVNLVYKSYNLPDSVHSRSSSFMFKESDNKILSITDL